MKKKMVFVIIVVVLIIGGGLIYLTSNRNNEVPNIEDSNVFLKSNEDYFEWDRETTIIGLTEEGKKQKALAIPAKCELVGATCLQDGIFEYITFENPDTMLDVSGVFYGCTELKSIELPENLKIIPWGTLSGCTNLESIVIPSCVTEIEHNAFSKCTNLKNVILSDALITIGDNAFSFAGITEIVLPTTLEIIGNDSFRSTEISMLSLPQGLKTIGTRAFYWCYDLTQLIIPSSVTSIGDNSLPSNNNTTVVLEGVTYNLLNDDKFANPENLNYVSLLLPSVTENSIASDVKNSCIFESVYMGVTFAPKVYYNWSGSGTYENATDSEKLNKANYTSL